MVKTGLKDLGRYEGQMVSIVGAIVADDGTGRYYLTDGAASKVESFPHSSDSSEFNAALAKSLKQFGSGEQLVRIEGLVQASPHLSSPQIPDQGGLPPEGGESRKCVLRLFKVDPSVTIAEVMAYGGSLPGKTVQIEGWLYNRRSSGKIQFLEVRDGSAICQAIVEKKRVGDEVFEKLDRLPSQSYIKFDSVVQVAPRTGVPELGVTEVLEIEAVPEQWEYPITPKEHGVEYLMTQRHLWLRQPRQVDIQRVRHRIVKAIRDFFDDRGFTLFDAPILTPNAAEGTSTLFELEYFDEGKAYLTQSGQLYGEAGAMALGKVYVFGPTFRAEKSKTRRHLTEFWMVEPEVAFMDLAGDMELAEQFVAYIVEMVLRDREPELLRLGRDLDKLRAVKAPFPKLHYDEAAQILKDFWGSMDAEEKEKRFASGHKEFVYGDDFGAPDETVISSRYDRPVIVHHYPAEVKAFYMKRDPNEPDKALAMDVLAPEGYGEIIGGSQREDDYDTLLGRINEHKLPVEAFEWYLDLRRYGSVPHAGFGLGVERTVAWICGIEHVRETIPFPRTLNRIWP